MFDFLCSIIFWLYMSKMLLISWDVVLLFFNSDWFCQDVSFLLGSSRSIYCCCFNSISDSFSFLVKSYLRFKNCRFVFRSLVLDFLSKFIRISHRCWNFAIHDTCHSFGLKLDGSFGVFEIMGLTTLEQEILALALL
jgi:hypothetical protein